MTGSYVTLLATEKDDSGDWFSSLRKLTVQLMDSSTRDSFDVDHVAKYVPPSEELLEYYRNRIAAFEREREDMLSKFRDVQVQHEELHHLRWELRVREEEVVELQKALSDANVYLYDEREQVLKLASENESLKIQEMEDRRRIQHLLALTEHTSEDVTFFRDCRPEAMARPGGPSGVSGRPSGAPGHGTGATGGASPHKSRVLRTVYLPNERTDALQLQVQALQRQLAELRRLNEDRTNAWRADRESREATAHRKAEADAERLRALEEELRATREQVQTVTKELLTTRHRADQKERDLREELAQCQARETQASTALQETEAKAEKEVASLRKAAQAEAKKLRDAAQMSAERRNNDLRLLRRQYETLQKTYDARIQTLEQQLGKTRKKYHELERRRALENEGFSTDVMQLRRALRQLEIQWAVMKDAAVHSGEAVDPWQAAASEWVASAHHNRPSRRPRSRSSTKARPTPVPVSLSSSASSPFRPTAGAHAAPLQPAMQESGVTWHAARAAGLRAVEPEAMDVSGTSESAMAAEGEEDDGPFVGEDRADDDMRFGEAGRLDQVWRPERIQAELGRLHGRTQALAQTAAAIERPRSSGRRLRA